MKTTIVPAQITTVEDKIAGSLSFNQLILLIAPVFLSGLAYIAIPPFTEFTMLKAFSIGILTIICMTLAIRIKGKLIMEWIVIKSRYNTRPRVYVFNKNDSYLRKKPVPEEVAVIEESVIEKIIEDIPELHVKDLLHLESLVSDPRADFHIRTSKKGGLNVNIKQIK